MPDIRIRWSDNTADLVTRLKEGHNQIEATKASVEKLVQSFSGDKLIAAAHRYTAAIAQIGGAEKLTSAERQRTNDLLTRAIEKYTLLGKVAPEAMKQLAAATTTVVSPTQSVANAMTAMGKSVATSAAGFFTAQVALDALKGTISAVTEEIKKLALEGAGFNDVTENFQRMTEAAGLLGDEMLGSMREGSQNTINDFELMKLVNQNLGAGLRLTATDMGTLTKGAFALAQTTGTDVLSGLQAMNDAMLTGRTRALALLTGKIDLEKAEKAFAASIGTTRDALTEEGKLEAARVAILQSVESALGRIGTQTAGLDEWVQQATVSWQNFEHELGGVIANSDVLEAGFNGLREALSKAFGANQADIIKTLAKQVDDLAITLIGLAEVGVKAVGFMITEFLALYKVIGNLVQVLQIAIVGFKVAALGAAKMTFDTEGAARITAELDAMKTSIDERGAAMQEATRLQERLAAGTDVLSDTLATMRQRMIAARDAHVDFVGPVDEARESVVGAGQAVEDTNRFVQQSASDLKKAAEAWEEYNSIAGSVHDQLSADMIAAIQYDLERGQSQATLQKIYGVTATQLRLIAAEMEAVKKFELMPTQGTGGIEQLGIQANVAKDALGSALITMHALSLSSDKVIDAFAGMGTQLKPSMDDFKHTVTTSIAESMKDLPNLLIASFTGGGNWKGALNAMGTKITQGLFGADGPLKGVTAGVGNFVTSMTKGLGKSVSGVLGSVVGGMVPIIGGLIGPAVELLGKGFKKLMGGPSEAELAGREVKKKFQESFGTHQDMLVAVTKAYEATGRGAEAAKKDIDALIAAEKEGAEATKKMVDKIQEAFKEVEQRWEFTQQAAKDLNAFTKEGISDQGRYTIAVGSAVAIFDEYLRKTGDVLGALEAIGPALDAISQAQEESGFAGSAMIEPLLRMREVKEQFPGLIEQIGVSTRLLDSLGKAGLLNGELLTAFGQNAVNQFLQLKQGTGDARLAMTMMQPELQKLWEHQQKFGLVTDEATLKLLKEAEVQGIVGEDMKDVNEQILDVMEDIRDVLAEATGQAGRFGDAINNIPDRTVNVDVNYNDPGFEGQEPSGEPPTQVATGGLVTGTGVRRNIAYFAHGGRVVAPTVYYQTGGVVRALSSSFAPSHGSDTVPAMLTPGEEVTSVADRSTFLAGMDQVQGSLRQLVAAMGEPRPIIMLADSREIARGQVRVLDNGGALRTEWREVLGVSS